MNNTRTLAAVLAATATILSIAAMGCNKQDSDTSASPSPTPAGVASPGSPAGAPRRQQAQLATPPPLAPPPGPAGGK